MERKSLFELQIGKSKIERNTTPNFEKPMKLVSLYRISSQKAILSQENKNLLYGAFLTNINDEIQICFKKFHKKLKEDEVKTTILCGAIDEITHTEITKKFKCYIEKQVVKDYRSSSNFSYDLNPALTEEEKISDNEILEKEKEKIAQKILIFKNCISLASEIAKFYDSYNGW